MAACVGVTLLVCGELSGDELVKSGLMVVMAGGPIAVYRLWQGKEQEK